jgi:3'(2'), 5'-bisphosphate nucleotidase
MLEREIREAARIARTAGDILMEVYATDFDVAFKSGSDPVTDADTRANAYIVAELRRAFPDDGIVAEENEDNSDALQSGRCWYVDPLDGTREFVARNGEFAVMVGLAIDGASSAGAVYQPGVDKLYTGVVGTGAFLEHGGERRRLEVSQVATPAELKLIVSRSHRNQAVSHVVEELGIRKEATSGSVGLKAGLIAEGEADVYVHISDRSSMWDACGPEAVLRAAGGRFTDLNGAAFHYGGRDMRNRSGILACNAAAYDTVLPVAQAAARYIGLVE